MGVGADLMASNLSGKGCNPSASILWPKYDTAEAMNKHLLSDSTVSVLLQGTVNVFARPHPSLICHRGTVQLNFNLTHAGCMHALS